MPLYMFLCTSVDVFVCSFLQHVLYADELSRIGYIKAGFCCSQKQAVPARLFSLHENIELVSEMATCFQFVVDGDTSTYKAQIDDSGKIQMLRVLSFMGAVFIDVRDWFTTSAGPCLPTKRGVRLTVDEWRAICDQHESVSDAILKWHCRLLEAPTPVLDSASEVAQVAVAIDDNLKVYVVPASLAPNAKKTDSGVRVVIEKLSAATTTAVAAAKKKKTAVSVTPLTWYRLMLRENRQEVQSIITALRAEIEATSARKHHDSLAAEAALFKNSLDLSQL